MSIVKNFKCDVCSSESEYPHRWFRVFRSRDKEKFSISFRMLIPEDVDLIEYIDKTAIKDCCGEECLNKVLEEWKKEMVDFWDQVYNKSLIVGNGE